MSKKEQFIDFAKSHPSLTEYVNNNEMTWQKFYELYDIYGEDNSIWDKYLERKLVLPTTLTSITGYIKNIKPANIQKHINTAQKAINLFQEISGKKTTDLSKSIKGPLKERPINKIFED